MSRAVILQKPTICARTTIPILGFDVCFRPIDYTIIRSHPALKTDEQWLQVWRVNHSELARTRKRRRFSVERQACLCSLGLSGLARSGLGGCPQRFRNFAGDVVLDHQDVVQRAVIDFRPDNVPVVGTNQPRSDP